MATYVLAHPKYYGLRGLVSVPLSHAQEDASETWEQGALLVRNASTGRMAEAGADPTLVAGVSMANASGVTARDCIFIKPMNGVLFEMTLENSGGLGVAALELTDIGKSYGVARAAGAEWYVDKADTTNLVVKIVEETLHISVVGDVVPRVVVEFLPATYQG